MQACHIKIHVGCFTVLCYTLQSVARLHSEASEILKLATSRASAVQMLVGAWDILGPLAPLHSA